LKRVFSILLLSLSVIFITHSQAIDYGLFIKSYPYEDLEKTSLILENNKPLKLYKKTTLSFDMLLRKENAFGMVFRIITKNRENIDFSISINKEEQRFPMLIINESLNVLPKEVKYDEWLPASITFDSQKNEIFFTYNNDSITLPYNVSKIKSVQIAFGLCPIYDYSIYDIASVNLKNIKIFNGEKLERYWKLENYNNNLSFDSIKNIPAIAHNPQWIIDDYSSWEKVYSKKIEAQSLFAYNSSKNKLYMVPFNQNEIIIFDTKENQETRIKTKNSYTQSTESNRLVYDELKDELIIYNLEEKVLCKLSFEDLTWKTIQNTAFAESFGYWDSSRFYSAIDSTLYSFGGYGYYKFNNELVYLNIHSNSVQKAILNQISPRYFSSTTKSDNLLYIFGGKGSNTGLQEISPQFYYDLYSIDVTNQNVTKLLELKDIKENFFPGENMIYDKNENCFYIITDINNLTLIRLDKESANYEQVSLPMQEMIPETTIYRNLYLSKEQKKFYALTSTGATNNFFEINIHSLNYPIVPLNREKNIKTENNSILPIGIIILAICLVFVLFLFFKRKSTQNLSKKSTLFFKKRTEITQNYYDFSKQSICFLGGFSITDKNGENITKQFSPMLKNLLLLLLLYKQQNKDGIPDKKLVQALWPDKSPESAKNNKNVYISKLRSALESVGKIEIINENTSWIINWDTEVNCDYIETLNLFSLIKEHNFSNNEEIIKLLELLERGALLPNNEMEWVDSFKSDFSNQIIDILTELSQNIEYVSNDAVKLKIAEILFLHDYLNEEALHLKCSVFINYGKKGIAKNIYETFCKEYLSLLGVKYNWSFSDVINRKNFT